MLPPSREPAAVSSQTSRAAPTSPSLPEKKWHEPEINFYRRRYAAKWMESYDVEDPSYFWRSPNALPPPNTIISFSILRAIPA